MSAVITRASLVNSIASLTCLIKSKHFSCFVFQDLTLLLFLFALLKCHSSITFPSGNKDTMLECCVPAKRWHFFQLDISAVLSKQLTLVLHFCRSAPDVTWSVRNPFIVRLLENSGEELPVKNITTYIACISSPHHTEIKIREQ